MSKKKGYIFAFVGGMLLALAIPGWRWLPLVIGVHLTGLSYVILLRGIDNE